MKLKEAELSKLFRDGVKPGWWDKEACKISYEILNDLFEYSYKVDGRQEDLMSAVLKILDSYWSVKYTFS